MSQLEPSTIYLEPGLRRALKVKAAVSDRSLSDLVNEAVRESLREDAVDLAAARRRRREPRIPFEQVLRGLKRKGLL